MEQIRISIVLVFWLKNICEFNPEWKLHFHSLYTDFVMIFWGAGLDKVAIAIDTFLIYQY